MFKFAYDSSGHKQEMIKPLVIATATAVKCGAFVKNTPGTGTAKAGATDAVAGVAIESHDGVTAGRQTGTELKVSASPTAVYELKTRAVITATGGSTTTFADTNLKPATDDIFNGGYIEVMTCAANAAMIGKVIPITDYTGATGTITFAAQPYAFAAGDTVRLYPGKLAIGTTSWPLSSNGDDINYEAASGTNVELYDVDPVNKLAFFKPIKHAFGDIQG